MKLFLVLVSLAGVVLGDQANGAHMTTCLLQTVTVTVTLAGDSSPSSPTASQPAPSSPRVPAPVGAMHYWNTTATPCHSRPWMNSTTLATSTHAGAEGTTASSSAGTGVCTCTCSSTASSVDTTTTMYSTDRAANTSTSSSGAAQSTAVPSTPANADETPWNNGGRWGGIWLINRCAAPVYFGTAVNAAEAHDAVEVAGGESVFEPFRVAHYGAASVKIAAEPYARLDGWLGLMQLEYNLNTVERDRMVVDLSLIDCGEHVDGPDSGDLGDGDGDGDAQAAPYRRLGACPNRAGGYLARWAPHAARFGCDEDLTAYCPPSADERSPCRDAYWGPHDDQLASRTCVFDSANWGLLDFHLTFCPTWEDVALANSTGVLP